ncbi:MAG: hypothetical protein FJ109_17355, partial [Deltaproteobacteria bacterium]|nr:hypothetical protein [Deltaproteobacteria bacterium]
IGNGFQHPPKYCTYRSICASCSTDADCTAKMAENLCITSAKCNATGYCDMNMVQCDDKDPCTEDECNIFTGECVNSPIANCCDVVEDCVDTNPCTGRWCDVAKSKCNFPYYLCNDHDPCTADSCDYFTGNCKHEDLANCFDQCERDIDCLYYATPVNWCAVPTCDLDAKTMTMKCNYGAMECADSLQCTTMDCLPMFGCLTIPSVPCELPCAKDSECDDGDLCSIDKCNQVTGKCEHTNIECDDGDECTYKECDNRTGKCLFTPCPDCKCLDCAQQGPNFCDDGNVCTDDSCPQGAGLFHLCIHRWKTDCNDGNPCTQDVCDPVKGCVAIQIEKCIGCTSDAMCDDGNDCTIDSCTDAICDHLYICG